MTTVTVTTTYDQHSVPAIVDPAYRMELDGGALNVTRAIAIYHKSSGEPWQLVILRLAGHDDAGTANDAVVLESPDWPEWLTEFVADNLPNDVSRSTTPLS